jgi:Short C-terminal domain
MKPLNQAAIPGRFPSMPGIDGPSADPDLLERLEDLTDLYESGALSAAEFDAQRENLLAEG